MDEHRRTLREYRERVPPPDGYSLLGALLLATLVTTERATVRITETYRPTQWGGDWAWNVDPVVLPSTTEFEFLYDTAVTGTLRIPPASAVVGLDLILLAAVAYVGVEVVAAGVAASDLPDLHSFPRPPEFLAPTWPRIGATVAVVGFDAASPAGPALVGRDLYGPSLSAPFVTVYAESVASLLPSVSWHNTSTLQGADASVGVVLPALLALLATYYFVSLTVAGGRRICTCRYAASVARRFARLFGTLQARVGR